MEYTQILTRPNQIAMKFNNFFTNIGHSLANNLPPQCESHRKFMTDTYINSFLLSQTSPPEISSTVSSLRNSKSEGFDGLCISPIKASIHILASLFLISVISLSLQLFSLISSKLQKFSLSLKVMT